MSRGLGDVYKRQIQPSDSDMGGREVVDIKITGDLYGRLEEA